MFCTNCGQQLPEGVQRCPNCDRSVRQFAPPPPPAPIQNYLVPAILVTLCCCLPFGIVAIVFAAQVNSKLAGGDVAGAQASAKNAKMWTWISFGCGIVLGIIWFFVGFLGSLNHPR